jgi:enamine deaminase RidA (YjgF/YER057c/UK114 family)
MTDMQRRAATPSSIKAPFGRYNHGILLSGPPPTLHLSGQLGIAPDGSIPDDVTAQAEQAFANIDAILAEAGLARRHVVKLTTYLLEPADRLAYMAVRDTWVEEPAPASTLIFIKALALPALRVEIEALAVGDG